VFPSALRLRRPRGPLDVLVALKLGLPGQPELAAGAVAPGVTLILHEVVGALEISLRYVDAAVAELRSEVDERTWLLGGDRLFPDVVGRTVIVVDDGLATGATAAAAALGPQLGPRTGSGRRARGLYAGRCCPRKRRRRHGALDSRAVRASSE